jgi:hypothetical protein
MTRVVFGGFLVIFGIVGNALTLVIMFGDRAKSSTILVLFYLALTDLFVLLVYGFLVIPVPILQALHMDLLSSQIFVIQRTYVSHIGMTTNQISVLLTMIVAWQRYVSVCHPHKAKFHGRTSLIHRQMIGAVVFSVVFYLPGFFQSDLQRAPDGKIRAPRAPFADNAIYQTLYSIVLYYLVSYIIPMVAVTFMTFRLIQALRKAKVRVEAMQGSSNKPREELTRTLVIVIVVFMLCQSIGPVQRILMWVYGPQYYSNVAVKCGGPLFFFGPFVLLSLLMNSAANFAIYILCAKRFRAKVGKLLFDRRRSDVGKHGMSLDNTHSPASKRQERPTPSQITAQC